jgi:5-(carboxyamino)imidazole ribonucleotide synthase
VTPHAAVASLDELAAAVERIGLPAILKTASFGYDGKGQHRLTSPLDIEPVWALVGHQPAILEKVVDFSLEFSVVAARGLDGGFAHYGAIENAHRNHILDVSVAPARMPEAAVTEAVAVTRAIMDELAYVGVLCVEFFLTADGRILVNEIAPRPHNSGHLTVDASITSQFEQQVRAICGLPLGATTLLRPAAMANLLGDVWAKGEPKWDAALAVPDVKLHLYGKSDPRPGRKMGHLTAMADTTAQAIQHVLAARDVLV